MLLSFTELSWLLLACLFSYFSTWWLINFLKNRQVFDIPNNRSNHKSPTPRGGGIAVVFTIIIGILGINFFSHSISTTIFTMISIGTILALISFLDDIKGLPFWLRLLVQIICVSFALYFQPQLNIAPDILPVWLDKILITLCWVWFINLYNFMDGIDGISAVESSSINIGLLILYSITGITSWESNALPIVIIGATLGFLVWNWHPAKIFLGDVGSIFLGFIIGWQLLELASTNYLIPALILPLYYIVDSSFTLTKRALSKEKFWQPHSKHAYQKAVRSGWSHNKVSSIILILNIILIILSITSITMQNYETISFSVALILTTLLIILFSKKKLNAEQAPH